MIEKLDMFDFGQATDDDETGRRMEGGRKSRKIRDVQAGGA